jgi:hypothetical protein
LLAPDYSKKPMKLSSLPGKRANPYSIPWHNVCCSS